MTTRTWAERMAERRYGNDGWKMPYASGLMREHARAVRIVKRFIRHYAADRDLIERTVAQNILAALQRGRTMGG